MDCRARWRRDGRLRLVSQALMSRALSGFHIRVPTDGELAPALELLSPSFRGGATLLTWTALGQPGDLLLGAAAIRPPARRGQPALFEIFVESPYRRRGVGAALIRHLYQHAYNRRAGLQLFGFVHQDAPDHAFYRAQGLQAVHTMKTYSVPLRAGWPTAERIMNRYRASHPHLAGVEVIPLALVDHPPIAEFIAAHYPGAEFDHQLSWLRAGHYDLMISTGAMRAGRLVGALMMRSQQDAPSVFVDILLTDPAIRHGPTPVLLIGEMIRRALADGFTHAVYEADERYDSFAVSYARRCGAAPRWSRYRYAIDRKAIAAQLDQAAR